jgi:uncharacterized membrane protein
VSDGYSGGADEGAESEGIMTIWIAIFLFLHVMGAIIAFGPAFSTFPIIGQMAGKEPQHANFAARLSGRIFQVRVLPLAVFQGITGLVLIYLTGLNPFSQLWLGLGIVLYLAALGYATAVQAPTGRRIAELTATPPPPGASGPPPELAAAVTRSRQGSMLLQVLLVAIVILMVTKPTI